MNKVAFLGGDPFAVPSLFSLAKADNISLAFVGCPPERPAGRGMEIKEGVIAKAAAKIGLECVRLANASEIARHLEKTAADFCVVCAFGMKLDNGAISAPRKDCINIHASLLPRWRGAAPVERAILAGDGKTGVTIMRLSERIDAGMILMQEEIGIGDQETSGMLRERLASLGAKMVVRAIDSFDGLVPVPQDKKAATYAKKLDKKESRLDWSEDADTLHRKVRAFNPRPGAYCLVNEKRLKVLEAKIAPGGHEPGRLVEADRETVTIACGDKCLRLIKVVPAGGKPMQAAAWLRGVRNPPQLGSAFI